MAAASGSSRRPAAGRRSTSRCPGGPTAMPRLLLVEDAPDVALVVAHLGRRLGLEVLQRADVASAWDCARAAAPDLVLLDLNLGGERGEGLCRRLRAAPETARVPVALF